MLTNITPKITIDNNGMTTTKTSAALTSIVNAITIAPSTTNGERKNKRSAILTAACNWFVSLVKRVINVELPTWSTSPNDKD